MASAVAWGADPTEVYFRAEKAFTAGDWLKAATLYTEAAEVVDDARRSVCYERLLRIHARLGRLDQAIRSGLRCRNVLLRIDASDRVPEIDLQVGECYLLLGHHPEANRYLEQALSGGSDTLAPLRRLTALLKLARSAEKQGDRAAAARWWARTEKVALRELAAPQDISQRDRIEYTWRLADSYLFQKKPDAAISRLEPLLPIHDRLDDPAGKRDTLRRLAAHSTLRRDPAQAEKYVREALALHQALNPSDPVLHGELAEELANAAEAQNHRDEALKRQKEAAEAYQSALRDAGADRAASASAVPVFWKLDKLYQKMSRYAQALQLTEMQATHWSGNALLDPRLQSELGALRMLRGQTADARPVLREAVAALESQTPPNLVDLPRALTNLAAVEEVTGELDRAEALTGRCLELYRRYELPDDVILLELRNVEGICAIDRGRYSVAVERFTAGIDLCGQLGAIADTALANLLLNLALVHKSQGDLDEAARRCHETRAVYARLGSTDELGLAALDAATASLEATRGRIREAYALTPKLFEVCKKFDLVGGPILTTALHCVGLYQLSEGDYPAAEESWGRLRALQEEKEKRALLLPRTLNYLALTAERQGQADKAEVLYARARTAQQDNPRAFPTTHFITLWRLSGLLDRRGRKDEARALLEQALAVVEAARLQTYGAGEARAGFFAQFLPGFEQLTDVCLRDGDVDGALAAITRSRSRTLLDQLQLASVDPRVTLKGPQGDALRRKEDEQRLLINRLRARAALLPIEAIDDEKGKALLAQLDEAQQVYARTWTEILNANPLYRHLSADLSPAAFLPALRKALPPRTLLAVYCLGRERSHLLLLGGGGARAEAFPLLVPTEVAQRIGSVGTYSTAAALGRRRDIVLRKRKPPEEAPPPPPRPAGGPTVPLTVGVARDLIDQYCRQVSDPEFRPTRDIVLRPRQAEKPLDPQRIEFLADVLLPAEARRRIKASGAETLLVVPDGPLHKLPLEALVLEGGLKPRFVLDELPPIVYAPSAAVLALVAERAAVRGPLTLLSVCNPAYPQTKTALPTKTVSNVVLGLQGQMPLLPGTAEESRRVRARFDPKNVTLLEGKSATERAVVAAVGGKRILHLAAHGFADDRLGNLFGAIALTPPPPGEETAEEDGFLSLHEIYRLPLSDCELAVLSACETNVGPQQPLEAGVTLASGFLSAGARRVVASHWSVDDETTAVLMEGFFSQVTAAAAKGDRIDYARALHQARKKVRDQFDTATPFFWAPFVLLGAAD
jgi:CHAT domain-containing protein/tetratricopeptide (TPR) repeat protein